MMQTSFFFYLFGAVAIAAAAAAVSSRHILRAAVYLMGVLLSTAAMYVILGAEYLAGLQVLVYVGGVVVLLVFSVMLTQTNLLLEKPAAPVRQAAAFCGSALFTAFTYYSLRDMRFSPVSGVANSGGDPAAIGRSLLNYGAGGYALAFEIISVLLLAVVVGGIVIARKVAAVDVGAADAQSTAGKV